LRHTSLIVPPDVWAARKIETICSSLKRFFFIESLESGRGFYIIQWPSFLGAGQRHCNVQCRNLERDLDLQH
jgi:hypothetical protein